MTELDTAILLIKAASSADGGCSHCARGVLRHAMYLAPDLPWKIAATGLCVDNEDDYAFAMVCIDPD
jgi:hypothetical protein